MTHLMKLRKMAEKNEIISHCFDFHICKYFYFIIKENMIQITKEFSLMHIIGNSIDSLPNSDSENP